METNTETKKPDSFARRHPVMMAIAGGLLTVFALTFVVEMAAQRESAILLVVGVVAGVLLHREFSRKP